MSVPGQTSWRKRAEDNASFTFHMAEWIYARRMVGRRDAETWAMRAARIFPMCRHPELMDRVGRAFDWVIARTPPRKGHEVAADRRKIGANTK